MEEFRKTLKNRSALWLLVLIVSVIGIGLFFVFGGVLFGFDTGLRRSFGGMFGLLFLCSLFSFLSGIDTLSSEKKLKEVYIRDTDERNINIEVKSSRVTLNIVMVSLLIAFLLLTLFSSKNAGMIPGIGFYGIWLIKSIVKSYYSKKM